MAQLNAPTRAMLVISALSALVAALVLAIPLYVIRPFRPQGPHEMPFALAVREIAPWLSGLAAIVTIILLLRAWQLRPRLGVRLGLMFCCVAAGSSAALTHVNIFEKMFHPYRAPAFVEAADATVEPDDKVLSITIDGQTHAFPIRTMGYHHIVNDTLAGQPIAATYCTLCHTGLIWSRVLPGDPGGRILYFTLAGINNGNALLRDRETGSIWQQSTGEAIFGPLKGRTLTLLPSDELTFALWRAEQPAGLVLKPDAAFAALYDPKDWEAHVARSHVVVDVSRSGIDPHTIMLGIAHDQDSKAFPVESLLAAKLIEDHLSGQPVVLLVGPDRTSFRAFSPQLAGQKLSFIAAEQPGTMIDRETGSTWNFAGCATSGTLAGRCLDRIETHKDYWFDWLNHHPDTKLFRG